MKEKFKKLLENKKLLADVILISSILIIGLSFLLFTMLNKDDGKDGENSKTKNIAVVYVDGEKVAEYPLAQDGVYQINGYNGGTNILVIEDEMAYIREASCPKNTGDVACVHQGKIYCVGELITCLPNRVIVEIIGEGDDGLI